MLDTNDTTSMELSDQSGKYRLVEDWYHVLLSSCSVRAKNVLDTYQKSFASTNEFLESILNITEKEARNLRNCGRKTIREIIDLSLRLRRNIGSTNDIPKQLPVDSLPDNIDKILPLILERTDGLTVRARNAVRLFIQEQSNSVQQLYSAITSPGFKAGKLRNIGRNTIQEVEQFLNDTKDLIEQYDDSSTIESMASDISLPKLSGISINEEYQDHIWSLKEQLGYFPFFATISAYLNGLSSVTTAIINGCIRLYNGQTIADRKLIAEQLGLTSERVRQKRNKIIDNLADYFANIRKAGFVSENPYNFIMTHPEEYINSTEGTDFSPNFVRFALSAAFEEVTMIGDILKPLTSFYNDDLFVNIVPTELCAYFDFNEFVASLDEKLAEKRTDEERVNLKDFISPFFKLQYYEDYYKEVETACRSILYQTYPIEVDMGQMIFQPNSRKNNPDIIEDILRAAGHPMTLDELYDEFTFQYPERSVMYDSFRGNIGNNPNIIPVGRSSTYALIEWQNGDYRGGTIREFVSEFLDSLPSHIATVEATGEYVRQFRPNSSNESIVSNLNQDKSQKYSVYVRDGQKYVGYREYAYDLSFVLFDPERVAKRSTEESMALLTDFLIYISISPSVSKMIQKKQGCIVLWTICVACVIAEKWRKKWNLSGTNSAKNMANTSYREKRQKRLNLFLGRFTNT